MVININWNSLDLDSHVCAQLGDPVSKYLKGTLAESSGIVSSVTELQSAHFFTGATKQPGISA